MRIGFITPEAFPYAKTGGLADVTGALPRAFKEIGESCALFMPLYPDTKATETRLSFEILIGKEKKPARVFKTKDQISTYFIGNDFYFNRPGLYGTKDGDFPDNLERFAFFSQAAIEAIRRLNFQFDILHLHDWQTGLIPLYLRLKNDKLFHATKTVFTIHNLGYQGLFPNEKFALLNLPRQYYHINGIEYYNQVSFLKAGLLYADYLTTVSPTYAREIQTAEFGFGLEGVLRSRHNELAGILNGIDTEIWNPAKDPLIYYNYRNPADKRINKIQLKKQLKLDEGDTPLIGIVSRLASQKGIDIFSEALDKIIDRGFQVIILGTGDEVFHKILQDKTRRHPSKISLNLKFDEGLAHRIYAGADFFAMPSRYEPCGLGQLISLTYGTIPVVRKTGGLADSVSEFEPQSGNGNGFLFEEYDTESLLDALARAKKVYDNKDLWHQLITNSQKVDFSWPRAAREYLKVYQTLIKGS